MTSARTDVYGVIGHPVEHSLSPQIHGYFARATNQDMMYAAFHVLPERLCEAISGARGLGIKGLNVTIPHKQACLPYLKRVDEVAKRIGAVNTLVLEEGGYTGYNTDHVGMRASLDAMGVGIAGKTAVIVGAGGTARAAGIMCANGGASEIIVANRTVERANEIASIVSRFYCVRAKAIPLAELSNVKRKDLVIQTTSVGLNEPQGRSPVAAGSFFEGEGVGAVLELIYSPQETEFLRMARSKNIPAVNGFPALIFQAAAAFGMWRGVFLPLSLQQQAVAELEYLTNPA